MSNWKQTVNSTLVRTIGYQLVRPGEPKAAVVVARLEAVAANLELALRAAAASADAAAASATLAAQAAAAATAAADPVAAQPQP